MSHAGSLFVGRVGALAVALGVGYAVFGVPSLTSVAWADSTSADSSEGGAAPGGAGAAGCGDGDGGKSDTRSADSEADTGGRSFPEDREAPAGPKSSPDSRVVSDDAESDGESDPDVDGSAQVSDVVIGKIGHR